MKDKEYNKDIYLFYRPDVHKYIGEKRIVGKVLMLFAEEGTARFRIDDKIYTSDKNHMLFMHQHAEVALEMASEDYRCVLVGLPQIIQETATLQMDISFLVMLMRVPSWELDAQMQRMVRGFYSMFEFVCNDLDSGIKTDLVSSLFVLFLKVLYERVRNELPSLSPSSNVSLNGRSLISRFGKLLRQHFREDHRVAYYADILCVTPKYLTQVVKSTVGITPKDIIDRMLAMESLHQLKQPHLTIQQISSMLGFPDQSYFGRFFKRMFHTSPTQFRQELNMDLLHRLDENLRKKYPELENLNRYAKIKEFKF